MRTYNPLSVDELGQNAARSLMNYPDAPLPPTLSFDGAGVYTIHYGGPFDAYRDMSEPIYVGKADPPGKRQGRDRTKAVRSVLHDRLTKHARSIEQAENLHLKDFTCRWLVLDDVWIGLTEQVLTAEYRPLWNVLVAGFGINAPGKGRGEQRKSQWDTLHPGRPYAADLPPRDETPDDILTKIHLHRSPSRRCP